MRPIVILALCCAPLAAQLAQVDVFRSGEGGYHTYRIPALITTPKGTLLAFCEGRRGSSADSGDIDVLVRRSFDQGRTWKPVQVVADMGEDTVGNPTPVVERRRGTIFLLLTRNPGAVTERQIAASVPGPSAPSGSRAVTMTAPPGPRRSRSRRRSSAPNGRGTPPAWATASSCAAAVW